MKKGTAEALFLPQWDWVTAGCVLLASYPAVDLAPPPAVGSCLCVDLHHVALLQRELPGVAGAEVVPRDRHADHFWS